MNVNDTIINTLLKYDNIVFVYFFGSYSNGLDKFLSDIDIAIYFKEPVDLISLGKIICEINKVAYKKIDVVEMNNLFVKNPSLAYEIVTKGKSVICKDIDTLINFKTRTFLNYFDTINLRNAVNSKLYQRLSDRKFGKRNFA